MIRNVIFDWSGTLVDDLEAVWRSTNFTFEQAGRPVMTLDEFRSEFFLPFDQFYEQVTPGVSLDQLEEWYRTSFEEDQKNIRPLPHAVKFHQFCADEGLKTFLLSTIHGDHFRVQSKLTPFKFDHTYVRVMDKRAKISEILDDHELAKAETVFIGDMEHDVDTARIGGIFSCAVLTGYNTRAQLEAAGPDLIVEHLGDLQSMLQASRLEWPSSPRHEHKPHD